MISVIMTYYNTPYNLLKEAIDSVLNQNYKDIEFVLVDDCSDYNEEINNYLKEHSDRIKLIRNEINQGHSESRNIGVRESKGEYLFFIDSDDYLYKDSLDVLYHNLINNNADISIGNFSHSRKRISNNFPKVYTNMEALKIICYFPRSKIEEMTIPQVQFNATWNKIYKRELFNDIEFPKGLVHDDTFRMHKIFWKANKIVFTNYYTYMYRLNGNIVGKKLKDMVLAHEDRLNFVKEINDKFLITNEQRWYDKVLQEYNNDIIL